MRKGSSTFSLDPFIFVDIYYDMSRILGFDVSSETIGWGLVSTDNTSGHIILIDSGYLKPIKDGQIIDRIIDTRNKVNDIIIACKPDYIGIEDIIKFMKGKSTANTIIMLTTFNRMIGVLAFDYLKFRPELFNVMTIRNGLKIGKISPKKEDIPELVAKHLGITFPYEYKTGKRSKVTKIVDESFDRADGIAVALYYAFVLTGKIKQKRATVKKTKKKVAQKVKIVKKGLVH